MKNLRIIISGGGTGGHIYPAIAIADELKRLFPTVDILFVGAKDRMEMQKVPNAGYPIKGLWITGIQRKLTLKNMLFPVKLLNSLMKSRQILKEFKPHIAIGTGGFASGPLLKAAADKNIPTLIQEQNSHAGITNKWLSKKVDKICVAYAGMEKYFPADKIVFSGNPVRQDLLEISSKKEEARDYFALKEGKKIVLVLGGSLGARTINQLIEKQLETFKKNGVEVIWQTGTLYYDHYKNHLDPGYVQVHEYLNKMDLAYAAADIIVSRAGASSVSELCIVGKPVVFIPSPNVAEDHQTKNAEAISEKNAALLIREKDLETDFKPVFLRLLHSEEQQKTLSENILKLAKPNATQIIVAEIEKLVQSGKYE